MAVGHAGRDLSRITTGAWRAECSLRTCRWAAQTPSRKANAIRSARAHAATSGHDVILYAETTQRVSAEPVR